MALFICLLDALASAVDPAAVALTTTGATADVEDVEGVDVEDAAVVAAAVVVDVAVVVKLKLLEETI